MARKCQCIFPKPVEWMKGKVVGSGSFGTVHLAMDKSTGALFVVKSAETEVGIRSLENEANILGNLDSPYIVKCLGKDFSCTAEDSVRKFNLFIEYMPGGSLAEVVEKFGGKLDDDLIRLYTKKILQGLIYLHENGIVHCDVKCQNVLLGLSGNIKLADFGFAKKISNSKVEKGSSIQPNVGGTPLWMAPEVLRNERLDFAADIWSLGCTVIEMANGCCKSPWGIDFSYTNPMAAILKIANGNEIPQFPSNLSKEGLNFLSKCLERDPKKRWTAGELLKHPFIQGKSGSRNILENAFSPASILDSNLLDYNSDESSSDNEEDNEFVMSRGNPFSMRSCYGNKKLVSGNQLISSGDWITVRSNSQTI
ncbi:OLC1v1038859C1 [Oldenlandia corymbosa var. corymbosa]|uniref:OLC1v1038859C1 n=1 Tax=Oldenlandia corymbosa var. corymbosa TaxID=529605 RepID=A0AAV1D112_OLDCO|nr:OLC1v1038859C1 [Oldenlandia corymbosa var. corymbosa]